MRHGRGHTHVPPFNPSYESRLAEEEATLRWLIARQPRSLELSHYLLFLLAANGRDEQVIEKCLRILTRARTIRLLTGGGTRSA